MTRTLEARRSAHHLTPESPARVSASPARMQDRQPLSTARPTTEDNVWAPARPRRPSGGARS
ncbi:MAG TPA: hypothetical protein VN903_33725, partial [Polyangia bacterium]|nr:hypothetical protein [Polyangia bacterium]